MISITEIQEYLRHIAQKQYEVVKIPFFTLFFHPSDSFTFFNYAIPDAGEIKAIGDTLTKIRIEFSKRNRRARFEFLEEYCPNLARILLQHNFIEESRQFLMVCTKTTFTRGSEVAGLIIEEIDEQSSVQESQKFLTIQRRGFGGDETELAAENEAKYFLDNLGKGKAFVGVFENIPVAAGMISEPQNGISELAGLATLEPYRRQGIATAITTKAVERAFEQGAEVVFLTAAEKKAGLVYQKVGFKNYSIILAYIDENETSS